MVCVWSLEHYENLEAFPCQMDLPHLNIYGFPSKHPEIIPKWCQLPSRWAPFTLFLNPVKYGMARHL
jgi:hypothetical protein